MTRAVIPGNRTRPRMFRVSALLSALVLGLAPNFASADVASPFSPASPGATAIANLFWFFLIVAGLIFIGVEVALFYAIVRFRERSGQPPATFHGNVRVEVIWTALPLLLLIVVFVLTVRTMSAATAVSGDPLTVNVVGHQWWWEFDYPQEKIVTAGELHVPVGKSVVLRIQSVDVVHSFWVPQLAGKRDANPGFSNSITFTATQPGVYQAICSELCGVQHAWMRALVIADSPADYQAWVQQQQTPPPTATGLAAQGEQLFKSNACDSCHAQTSRAGPDLSHFALRGTLSGGVLDNTPNNLVQWLADPQAVKPGTKMPNYHFTPDQLQAMAAYLESLR